MARIIQIVPKLATPELQRAVWTATQQKNWYFGNYSTDPSQGGFWKMDLDDSPAITELWEHVKPQCEKVADTALKVVRQYANGHTHGQGGGIHVDDREPGTYTLLYYPAPEWKAEWGGETLWFSEQGEIAAGTLPLPNRGVFFDSNIAHVGRAPQKSYGGLRVTAAFKLADDHGKVKCADS